MKGQTKIYRMPWPGFGDFHSPKRQSASYLMGQKSYCPHLLWEKLLPPFSFGKKIVAPFFHWGKEYLAPFYSSS